MPVNTHNVTHDVVVYEEWSPGGTIYEADDTSRRIHRALIEGWVESGAGLLNGILESKGIDPDELADYPNAQAMVRAAIIDYVMHRIMRKLGETGAAESYLESFRDARNTLSKRPEELGDAQDPVDAVPSSVDLTAAPVSHAWGSEQW